MDHVMKTYNGQDTQCIELLTSALHGSGTLRDAVTSVAQEEPLSTG